LMSEGLFARISDEERQLVVGSWTNAVVNMAAVSSGAPWLIFASVPLQILARRFTDMWFGDGNRPARAFAVGGRNSRVWHRQSTGVYVDATPLFRRNSIMTQTIEGRFASSALSRQALRRGDPVALVVSDASWRTQNDGLVVPARFGEPFRVEVPRGRYKLSAYSLDPRGRPKVDPVTAIGVGSLSRNMAPVILRPRGRQLTRSMLTDLKRQPVLPPRSRCPNCGQVLLLSLPSCLNCGRKLDRPRASRRPLPRQTAQPGPFTAWLCTKCGMTNFVGATCFQCGRLRTTPRRRISLPVR
jgi:hypothetical protein